MDKLQSKVLVLNRYWQVINISTVRRALTLLFVGSAQAVQVDGGEFQTLDFPSWLDYSSRVDGDEEKIGTVRWRIAIPRIIILPHYEGYPSLALKLTRKNVYKRDNYTCQYCGKKYPPEYLNIDHVLPRHRGGRTTWENVVCSCIWCNFKKGGKTLEEAGMKLLKKPRIPYRLPFQKDDFLSQAHPSWRFFIDFSLWKVKVGEDDAPV